jgi:hypothetical protein
MGLFDEKKPEVKNLVTLSMGDFILKKSALTRGVIRTLPPDVCWQFSKGSLCKSITPPLD